MSATLRALKAAVLVASLAAFGVGAASSAVAQIVGAQRSHVVAKGDTLLDIARDNKLGFLALVAANHDLKLDPWVPRAGVEVAVPSAHILPDAPHSGIVINLAEMRLYYFRKDGSLETTVPIGIGREAFTTPRGETRIVRKQVDPVWRPTKETRADNPDLPAAVPPGPDNPMGKYALYLGWPSYAVHGTNQPWGVGRRVSRGCIRLFPEDIEALYAMVPIGTRVTVVDQIAKFAWRDGELFIEVHPSRAQYDELEESNTLSPETIAGLSQMVLRAARKEVDRIDWVAVDRAERERRGVPVRITASSAPEAAIPREAPLPPAAPASPRVETEFPDP